MSWESSEVHRGSEWELLCCPNWAPQRFYWKAGMGPWGLSPRWRYKAWIRCTRETCTLACKSTPFPKLPFISYIARVRAARSALVHRDATCMAGLALSLLALLPAPSTFESTNKPGRGQASTALASYPNPFPLQSQGNGTVLRPLASFSWLGPGGEASAAGPNILHSYFAWLAALLPKSLWGFF